MIQYKNLVNECGKKVTQLRTKKQFKVHYSFKIIKEVSF